MSLIDKIRKARETTVEADGRSFTVSRPTDEQAMLDRRDGLNLVQVVKKYTTGWDLVELDLIPGGNPERVPFDTAVFAEWVADQPAVWEPLGTAILDCYRRHSEARDAAAKN